MNHWLKQWTRKLLVALIFVFIFCLHLLYESFSLQFSQNLNSRHHTSFTVPPGYSLFCKFKKHISSAFGVTIANRAWRKSSRSHADDETLALGRATAEWRCENSSQAANCPAAQGWCLPLHALEMLCERTHTGNPGNEASSRVSSPPPAVAICSGRASVHSAQHMVIVNPLLASVCVCMCFFPLVQTHTLNPHETVSVSPCFLWFSVSVSICEV